MRKAGTLAVSHGSWDITSREGAAGTADGGMGSLRAWAVCMLGRSEWLALASSWNGSGSCVSGRLLDAERGRSTHT